jgi:hypothetical protein
MNNRKDFLEPIKLGREYLGLPIREERLPVDEILSGDIYKIDQSSVTDPDGTYRQIEAIVFDPETALTTGDKKIQAVAPFNATLVAAHARVVTASTSGVVQVTLTDRYDDDILDGVIEIDQDEYSSHNATNQPSVDNISKNFARHDVININVDAVGTGSEGLVVTLYFVVSQFFTSQ